MKYINHMGGTKSVACNNIAVSNWDFGIKHNFWISAAHIQCIDNTIADNQSRHFYDNTETTA